LGRFYGRQGEVSTAGKKAEVRRQKSKGNSGRDDHGKGQQKDEDEHGRDEV